MSSLNLFSKTESRRPIGNRFKRFDTYVLFIRCLK